MRTRLSYRPQDEHLASSLSTLLRRVGADVVSDTGNPCSDSSDDDTVVLLWSSAAAVAWGETLADVGLPSGLTGTGTTRLVPVRLDDTPLPRSLSVLRHIRLANSREPMTEGTAAMIVHMGPAAGTAPAVRGHYSERTVVISDFSRLGLFASCPRCGVSSERLRPYITVDHLADRPLRLVICGACSWQDACDL